MKKKFKTMTLGVNVINVIFFIADTPDKKASVFVLSLSNICCQGCV
jgi:hypothetical protein